MVINVLYCFENAFNSCTLCQSGFWYGPYGALPPELWGLGFWIPLKDFDPAEPLCQTYLSTLATSFICFVHWRIEDFKVFYAVSRYNMGNITCRRDSSNRRRPRRINGNRHHHYAHNHRHRCTCHWCPRLHLPEKERPL